MFNGQINYFYGPFSVANCHKLPEGRAFTKVLGIVDGSLEGVATENYSRG